MTAPMWSAWPIVIVALIYVYACIRYLLKHPHGEKRLVRIFGIVVGLYVAHLYINIAIGVIPVGELGALMARTGSFVTLSLVTWEVLLCRE